MILMCCPRILAHVATNQQQVKCSHAQQQQKVWDGRVSECEHGAAPAHAKRGGVYTPCAKPCVSRSRKQKGWFMQTGSRLKGSGVCVCVCAIRAPRGTQTGMGFWTNQQTKHMILGLAQCGFANRRTPSKQRRTPPNKPSGLQHNRSQTGNVTMTHKGMNLAAATN